MIRIVVDASVALKWVVQEIHTGAALRLLRAGHVMMAPDLLWAELGNALWKQGRRGLITFEEARALLADLRRMPVLSVAGGPLVEAALVLAQQWDRSLYDSLYVALALREGCKFVTADLRLVNGFAAGPLRDLLVWIEDV